MYNKIMQKSFLPQPVEKFQFELASAGDISFSNLQIFEGGAFLYVARCAINTNPSNALSIKLNDINNPSIPLRRGLKINVDFEKVYINGTSYADDSNGFPQLVIFKAYQNGAIELPSLAEGSRVKIISSGSSEKAGGEVAYVIALTSGQIDFFDESGTVQSMPFHAAGSVIPISPLSIRDSSTADVLLVYRD